jgi:hypothetical protein
MSLGNQSCIHLSTIIYISLLLHPSFPYYIILPTVSTCLDSVNIKISELFIVLLCWYHVPPKVLWYRVWEWWVGGIGATVGKFWGVQMELASIIYKYTISHANYMYLRNKQSENCQIGMVGSRQNSRDNRQLRYSPTLWKLWFERSWSGESYLLLSLSLLFVHCLI